MFKIGKKRESPDVAALNARLNARSPARGDEDAASLLSADDSPTTSRRSGSFLQADRPDMSLAPSMSNGDVKRPRSGSFLDRIRRPVFEHGSPGVQQDGYLGVAGHGPTGFIGDGSLTFGEQGLSGTAEDRRLSVASGGSPTPLDGSRSNIALATPPAPTLVVQRSSPEGASNTSLPGHAVSSETSSMNGVEGDPSDDELSRGRGIARDRDAPPRPPNPISISPSHPTVVLPDNPDGMAALANAHGAPDQADPRPSLNASTATRGSSRPPSRAASVDGRSPETRPRKLTVSSVDSHPPLTSSTRAKSKTKARAGSGGSVAERGIAGALALSGVALASPHPGLAQPRVLRSQHHGSPPASEENFRKHSRDDGATASREVSDSGHADSILDGTTSSEQHQYDHEVMMSMDTLGNFDDVMEQLGTGYAVASSKRNADFHAIFEDVPDDDYLIEDYGCALQKEILVQGRLYVSEHHICFNSNIFGWVTTLVIPFSDVMTVEKRMTALIIPNAIQVATMHKRHTFTSFLSRDSTYDLITNIWRISHPNVPVAVALPDESVSIDPDVVDAAAAAAGAGTGDDDEKKKAKSPKRKKTKTGDVKVIEPSEPLPSSKTGPPIEIQKVDGSPKAVKVAKAEHHPTVCHCEEKGEHFKNVALDTTFPTTPEKIYNLIYQSGFMRTFSIDVQKLTDLSFEDWKPGAAGAHLLKRSGSYVMPLSGPVGPKSTKCFITDEHQFVDYDHHITNITTTSTPDVPSGGNFSTITKTCITWAPKNSCRVLVTTQVEWTKVNRFLRSVIESSALAGQIKFHQNLETAIRAYIKQHRNEFDDGPSGDAASDDAVSDSASAAAIAAPSTAESVPTSKALADAKADSSPTGKIVDGLSDALGGLVELVTGQSPMMIAASVLVALLLLSNIWTLSSRHGAASIKSQQQGGGHDVAMAVRDVLEHYFSGQRPYGAYGGGGGRAGVSTRAEVEEMSRVLDALEDRIRTVRNALAQVAEASAGPTGEVTTPVA